MAFKSLKSSSKSKSSAAQQQLPPSLASELLLMQFIGGGSIERHAKRVMEQQAREVAAAGREHHANAPVVVEQLQSQSQKQSRKKTKKTKVDEDKSASAPLPVAQAFRDERGNMWWDEHEEAEYRGLLVSTAQALEEYEHDTDTSQEVQTEAWVSFDGESLRTSKELRRTSLHAVSPLPTISEFSRVHVVSSPPSLIDSDPFYSPYSGCASSETEASSVYTDGDVDDGDGSRLSECGEESGKENDDAGTRTGGHTEGRQRHGIGMPRMSVDAPLSPSKQNQNQAFEDSFAPALSATVDEGEAVSIKKKRTGLNLRGRAKALFRVSGR